MYIELVRCNLNRKLKIFLNFLLCVLLQVSVQVGNEVVRLQTNGSPFPARTFIEACLQFEALPPKVASYPHRSWALLLTSADQSHGKPAIYSILNALSGRHEKSPNEESTKTREVLLSTGTNCKVAK